MCAAEHNPYPRGRRDARLLALDVGALRRRGKDRGTGPAQGENGMRLARGPLDTTAPAGDAVPSAHCSRANTTCALDRGAGERSGVRGWIESRSANNAPATAGWMLRLSTYGVIIPEAGPFCRRRETA